MKRARPAVAEALGNEVVTAYYDDGQVKYTQQKNKIAAESYVTYSTAHWYDSDGREEAIAEYGTGNLPSPWPSNPPASSDSVHVTGYERDKLGRVTKATCQRVRQPEGCEQPLESSHRFDYLAARSADRAAEQSATALVERVQGPRAGVQVQSDLAHARPAGERICRRPEASWPWDASRDHQALQPAP